MHTIGQLAKRSGLSRSTLLYYDSIGLFSASGRSRSNYRMYKEEDARRLDQICTYRRAGLSLENITKIMKTRRKAGIVSVLEKRLDELNKEIRALRAQQHFILTLFKNDHSLSKIRVMDKTSWIKLLESAGLDSAARDKWHAEFERLSPDAHQDFLESLGIPAKEISLIRKFSRSRRQRSSIKKEPGSRLKMPGQVSECKEK